MMNLFISISYIQYRNEIITLKKFKPEYSNTNMIRSKIYQQIKCTIRTLYQESLNEKFYLLTSAAVSLTPAVAVAATAALRQPFTVFLSNMAMVIGPTPPGT